MRAGQQAALAVDLLALLDALHVESAVLAGYDWGGRAACIVSALWPFAGAGHNLPQENPRVFADAILSLVETPA